MPMRTPDEIIQVLRKHKISVTSNRVKVLCTAYQLQANITTVTVQKAIEYSIERTSIHRALHLFRKKGILCSVPNTNGLIEYKIPDEQMKDNTSKATFICRQCQQLNEIAITYMLLKDQQKLNMEKILIEGLCERCDYRH